MHSKPVTQRAASAKMSNASLGCTNTEFVTLKSVKLGSTRLPSHLLKKMTEGCIHYAVCDPVWEKIPVLPKQAEKGITEIKL